MSSPRVRQQHVWLAIGLVVGIAIGVAMGWYLAPGKGQVAVTQVRFTLDWAYQGPQAPFLVALYKGCFVVVD